MKKGEVQGQVVIYILAVIIASMILLYGYGVVKDLVSSQENILIVTFKEDVRSEVDRKSYEFRNVETLKFELPQYFDEACVVDLDKANDPLQERDLLNKIGSYVLIKNSVQSKVKRNFFLLNNGLINDGFYAGDLSIPDGFSCIPINTGQLELRFEALGKEGVKIS